MIVYGGLIRPELKIVSEKRGEVVSKETLLNNQRTAVSEVQKLIAQFQSIARLQENVSLAIPVGEATTEALNQWQSIVKLSGVSVRSFSRDERQGSQHEKFFRDVRYRRGRPWREVLAFSHGRDVLPRTITFLVV